MPKDTIDETQQALADLERRPSPTPPLAIPVALLAIALLCVALSWLRQSRPGLGLVLRVPQLPGSARVIGVPSISGEPLACILTRSGAAGREDLFLCTSAPTLTCQNLTESPGLTEAWPVVDPAGQHVVYYGVGESGTDLYMLTLPNGSALPLTLHAGESGLHSAFEITPTISPAFSPGSEWLAFPAQARKSSVVELFVARYDGQMVVRVSNLEYKVHDYLWLDDRTLVFAVQWPDGTFHYWRARLEGNVFQLEALP